MASLQHLGQGEVPSRGQPHRENMSLFASPPPRTFNFVERKATRPRNQSLLESAECVGVVVHGFFCDSFFFPSSTLSTMFLVVQINHPCFCFFYTNQRDEHCAAAFRINMKERGYCGRTVVQMSSIVSLLCMSYYT